jgi:hypothetical protein
MQRIFIIKNSLHTSSPLCDGCSLLALGGLSGLAEEMFAFFVLDIAALTPVRRVLPT